MTVSTNGLTSRHDVIVSLQGVQKSYDGISIVVKNLDLEIAQGEFLTLLGPSGSGKTTILMMLAGFEMPTDGEILLADKDITKLPPHRRGIGVVFQNYALFPHMTVEENIAYPLKVRGTAKAEITARVKQALSMVKLSGLGTRRPAQLSGGQQQRIALARALVFRPELVLLDEPLGALDKKLREQMQYELKQIHEELGVTMVYVTHDQSEALTMSDRIAVFNDGKIQQLAPPTDLYNRPLNAFVADFIGENNRLEGDVVATEENCVSVRLSDDSVVRAVAVDSFEQGDGVIISVRPERIFPHTGRDFENTFSATVDKQIYLGDSMRIVMRFGGSEEFVMKTSEYTKIEKGAMMRMGWRTEDCLAFKK